MLFVLTACVWVFTMYATYGEFVLNPTVQLPINPILSYIILFYLILSNIILSYLIVPQYIMH